MPFFPRQGDGASADWCRVRAWMCRERTGRGQGCFKRNTGRQTHLRQAAIEGGHSGNCFDVPPIDCSREGEEDPASEAQENDALMALFLQILTCYLQLQVSQTHNSVVAHSEYMML